MVRCWLTSPSDTLLRIINYRKSDEATFDIARSESDIQTRAPIANPQQRPFGVSVGSPDWLSHYNSHIKAGPSHPDLPSPSQEHLLTDNRDGFS